MRRLPLKKEALVEALCSATKELDELPSIRDDNAKAIADNLRRIAEEIEFAKIFKK